MASFAYMFRRHRLSISLMTGFMVILVIQSRTSMFQWTQCNNSPLMVKNDGVGSAVLRVPPVSVPAVDGVEIGDSFKYKDASTKISKEDEVESYKTPIRPLKLVSGFRTDILLFSAIAGNTTSNSTWDKIAITAWEAKALDNHTYICCVAFSSGAIKSFPATKLFRLDASPMKSTQYMCSLNKANLNDIPVAATIADAKRSVCHNYTASYVEVEFANAHPDEAAIFGKVFYGNISARDLLVWIEIHRLHGVNKFFIYPYEIPSDATKVLRYYQRQGVLDIVPFSRHTAGAFKNVGWEQYHNDQKVTEFDGLQRLRGYRYMVNFDVDEYIVPRNGETWLTLFDKLFQQQSDAGAFWFQSYIFVKSWDATNASSPFSIGRYTMRTDITADRRKFVVDPRKVTDIGLYTHYDYLKDGYKRYMVDHADAAIHHYRKCRGEWLKKGSDFPCYNVTRTKDDTVLNMFKTVEKDVMNLVTKLGI